KSHVGARGKRESTKPMAGRNARKQTARGHRAAVARARKADGHTRRELYEKAKQRHGEGRSKMTKRQVGNGVGMGWRRVERRFPLDVGSPSEEILMSRKRDPNGVEPEFSEDDIQREQFGPRGVPGAPDPAKMTPQREKKTPKHIDQGHTS